MSIGQTEFNILGCTIRLKANEDNDNKAHQAVSVLKDEVAKVKALHPQLKDLDIAVLSALNLASQLLDKDAEFKENVFAIKSGVEDALKYVEKVSPGPMQVQE